MKNFVCLLTQICLITVLAIAVNSKLFATTQKANYEEFQGTPERDRNNQHQKPNVHYRSLGLNEFDYYASGDVDNDGIPGTLEDAQKLKEGLQNDNLTQREKYRADVNADGVADSLDTKAINAYANGDGKLIGIDYTSPDHTLEEKKEFVTNIYRNCLMPMLPHTFNAAGEMVLLTDGWTCGPYATQAMIALKGISDIDKYLERSYISNPDFVKTFNTEVNGLFNIQANMRWQKTKNNIMHIITDIPLGDDLMNPDHHLVIDSQTGRLAGIGTVYHASKTTVDQVWEGIGDDGELYSHIINNSNIRSYWVIDDKITENPDVDFINEDYAYKRYEAPEGESTLEQKVYEYDDSKNYSLEELNAEPEFY
ncbi:MAG: hypothetical protein R6U66_00330, partial [Bacteroidales bacterium]